MVKAVHTVMFSVAMLLWAAAPGAWGQGSPEVPLEAVLSTGEKVRLFANGRWEYADPARAVEQRSAVEADRARERSSQGGFFGFGRRLYEGDPGYNRGSLNPKMR